MPRLSRARSSSVRRPAADAAHASSAKCTSASSHEDAASSSLPERVARLEARRLGARPSDRARARPRAPPPARSPARYATSASSAATTARDGVVARVLDAALERDLRRHQVAQRDRGAPEEQADAARRAARGRSPTAPSGTPPRPRRWPAHARSPARAGAAAHRPGSVAHGVHPARHELAPRRASPRASVRARVCASSAAAHAPTSDEQLGRARLRPRVVLEASRQRARHGLDRFVRTPQSASASARASHAGSSATQPPVRPRRACARERLDRPPRPRRGRRRPPPATRARPGASSVARRSARGGQRAVGRVQRASGACRAFVPPCVERRDGVRRHVEMRGLGHAPSTSAGARADRASRRSRRRRRADRRSGSALVADEHHGGRRGASTPARAATARSQLPAAGRAATTSARRWIAARAMTPRRPTDRSAACSRPGATRPRARAERPRAARASMAQSPAARARRADVRRDGVGGLARGGADDDDAGGGARHAVVELDETARRNRGDRRGKDARRGKRVGHEGHEGYLRKVLRQATKCVYFSGKLGVIGRVEHCAASEMTTATAARPALAKHRACLAGGRGKCSGRLRICCAVPADRQGTHGATSATVQRATTSARPPVRASAPSCLPR